MEKSIKCPFCGSNQVKSTALGYSEKVATGVVAGVAGMFVNSLLRIHTRTTGIIMESIPSEYKCKRCNKTFHENKK